jgi:hypothetical protein
MTGDAFWPIDYFAKPFTLRMMVVDISDARPLADPNHPHR